MGVRPPQSDGDRRDPVEFGIPVLAERVNDSELAFPATSDEIVQALGDPDVPIDAKGHAVKLSSALEDVDEPEFASERELLDRLHPVFEARRAGASAGILGSIRSILPF